MTRFTIYTYLFKPINQPQEPDMFSPEVKVGESLAMKQELLGELFLEESKLRFTKSRNNSDSEGHTVPGTLLRYDSLAELSQNSSQSKSSFQSKDAIL